MSFIFIVFLAVFFVQTLFLSSWLAAFIRYNAGPAGEAQPVSVVVAARNEAENLKSLIPLLLDQIHPDFEIIIVNDRSEDETSAFLGAIDDPRVRSIDIVDLPDGWNGKKNALSEGIKAAGKAIILVTDADCRPESPHWISRMSSRLQNSDFVLGYSPYYKTSGLLNAFIRFETLWTGIQFIGSALIGRPYMGVGRNLAYRKSVFMMSGGFEGINGVTGGDDDLLVNSLAHKRNTRVCLGKDALTYSFPKETWGSFFHQKTRHLSVGKRYKWMDKLWLAVFFGSMLLTWFLGLALLFTTTFVTAALVALILRLILVMILVNVASVRLGDEFALGTVFVLDFLYVFYYLSTGLRAITTRHIQWTN